jgi:hypothetical protein
MVARKLGASQLARQMARRCTVSSNMVITTVQLLGRNPAVRTDQILFTGVITIMSKSTMTI